MPIHAAMLGDEVRTLAWLNAVRAQVRPGDVVVDVGTGTGILAVAAVQAGARHVYALEASSCIGAARALIDANGVADRVTLIRGWSTALELPERADVLVSEILDDDPFGEGILEVTADSWQRHLKPDARQLPRALTLYGQLVEMDEETLRTHTWTPLGLE
ncbi:MAG TPA: 50S ribosomal protein L11 methyltransferase, partial [Polyangiaceae bacterium]|nr:50S ribosomal protein L11 methyltransferase [Polyangiaceae bacterium]